MVELALTPDGRWTAPAGDYLESAAAAGFRAVGLSLAQAAGLGPGLSSRGMRCHEMLALTILKDREATEAQAHAMAAGVAEVGAQFALVLFRTKRQPEALSLASRCADILGEAGARLAIEFGPGGPVGSIPDALEVVEAVGGPARAGVMIDTWHFSHGPSTFEDLAAVPLDHIAYVQFDDAPAWESEDVMHETLNRRQWPGEGILELGRFTTTLLERGWDGIVSAEVLNADYVRLPLGDYCRRAWESMARYWL